MYFRSTTAYDNLLQQNKFIQIAKDLQKKVDQITGKISDKSDLSDDDLKTIEIYEFLRGKEIEKALLQINEIVYWKKKRNGFISSAEIIYIYQFIKIYGNKKIEANISQLQLLLKHRGWCFPIEQLVYLIDDVYEEQIYQTVRTKISSNYENKNRREILISYIDNYRSTDSDNLKILFKILQENQLEVKSLAELQIELKNIEEEIEVKKFEKFLQVKSQYNYLEIIDDYNGYEFESFLKDLFLKMGYYVEQTKISGDQGADLVLTKFGEKTIVQAKRYSAKVSNSAIQETVAALSYYNAQKGMVVTNNYFTDSASDLAEANNIELINRDSLEILITNYW